jgi:glutamate carboxypeptidase
MITPGSRRYVHALIPSAALWLIASCVSAQLDDTERAMVAWIEAHAAEAEALIESTVNINSGTMNLAGVRTVAEVLEPELAALGFETEWLDMAEVNRAGHLFARHIPAAGEAAGRRILMIGHLDTVFEPNSGFLTFEREAGTTWATGPGVEDMKSGNVVMLYALKALAAVGALGRAQIVVAYTGDEENPGEPLATTRRDLIEAGQWADISLGFEGGRRDGDIEWATVARRGFSGWQLEVTGVQAHSSQIFSEGVGAGAIFEAARILSGFYAEVRGEEYLTFNAGTILGGTDIQYDYEETRGGVSSKTNIVPRRVVVQGEIRAISQEQLERARATMRELVSRGLPHTQASISFADGYPAMAPTEGNLRLQGMLSDINVALGGAPMPALDPLRRGAADISFVAPYTDGLAGLGGVGQNGHTPEERLDLASIPRVVQRAALLIYRLTRNGDIPH